MKNRKIQNHRISIQNKLAACAAICLISAGCGMGYANFSLALEEIPSGSDRLVGLFITDTHIDSGTPEIILDSRGELTFREQDPKIYGSLTDDGSETPVTFSGLEGYGIYSLQLQAEDSPDICNIFSADDVFTDLHYTASGNNNTVEASLYVRADRPCARYFHPVYQQADGRIYLLPGSGVSSDSFSEGTQYSQSVSQSQSTVLSGHEDTEESGFTVTLVAAASVENTEVIFMDRKNQVIGILPEQQLDALFKKESARLELPDHTAYVILQQTTTHSGETCRSLFDQGEEYLEYMVSGEDEYLHSRQLLLVWPEDALLSP